MNLLNGDSLFQSVILCQNAVVFNPFLIAKAMLIDDVSSKKHSEMRYFEAPSL